MSNLEDIIEQSTYVNDILHIGNVVWDNRKYNVVHFSSYGLDYIRGLYNCHLCSNDQITCATLHDTYTHRIYLCTTCHGVCNNLEEYYASNSFCDNSWVFRMTNKRKYLYVENRIKDNDYNIILSLNVIYANLHNTTKIFFMYREACAPLIHDVRNMILRHFVMIELM